MALQCQSRDTEIAWLSWSQRGSRGCVQRGCSFRIRRRLFLLALRCHLEDRACGDWGTGWWLLCKRHRCSQRTPGMQIHQRDHGWDWAYISCTPGISVTDSLSPTVSCFSISWMWSQSESQKWKSLSLPMSYIPNRVGTSEVLCVIQKLAEIRGVPPRVVCHFSGRRNCLISVPFKPRGEIGRKCTGCLVKFMSNWVRIDSTEK